jgi:hypothetical protein
MSIPNRKVDPNEVRYGQLGTIIPSYTYTYMGLKTNIAINSKYHLSIFSFSYVYNDGYHTMTGSFFYFQLLLCDKCDDEEKLKTEKWTSHCMVPIIMYIGETENRQMNQLLSATL